MLTRLKELRKEFSLSQQKLANELGISQQSINKYENHDVEPDISMLKSMADYFGTTVDYLVGYTDDPAKPIDGVSCALSREESVLVREYRKLSDSEKQSIRLVMGNYLRNRFESKADKT